MTKILEGEILRMPKIPSLQPLNLAILPHYLESGVWELQVSLSIMFESSTTTPSDESK